MDETKAREAQEESLREGIYRETVCLISRLEMEGETLATLQNEKRWKEQAYALFIADQEQQIIHDAGGPKGLGSNEAERKRKMIMLLDSYPSFKTRQESINKIILQVALQAVQVDHLKRRVALATAYLSAGG